MGFTGVECSTPADIVDAFGEYFSRIYIEFHSNHLPIFNDASNATIKVSSITQKDVELALRKTKNSFTSGSDGIPGFVVRDCADTLAKSLRVIFNLFYLNFACFTQYVSEALDAKDQVDAIYLGMLESFGFYVPLCTLLKSYLTSRHIQVC
ncbi:hypothetical protein Trydic_g20046 [Trypoxylus dichotomus]